MRPLLSLVAAACLVAAALFVPLAVTSGEIAMNTLQTDPMHDDPAKLRTAFLSLIPKGSPITLLRDVLGPEHYDPNCRNDDSGVTCAFDVRRSLLRAYRSGFEFTVRLDASKTVQDVAFRTY